ncbi:MAG TPA: carbamoyltransferase N-terminal domain-containing protein, partial [Candidatus Omnitrophota bacterium]|nr:carbamoyltransferase N-terminal domain-containing protein [Candidatus Omnitrophota bacterium]
MPQSNDIYILGISAFYHDSAAALVKNGEIVAAAQEERFTRKKHDHDFPKNAVDFCLTFAGITVDQLSHVVFYDKPFIKFERLLETYLMTAPFGIKSFLKAMPLWLKEKLFLRDTIAEELNFKGEVLFADHHESHAASAFFPSPFESAAIMTLDGVGEWSTLTLGSGKANGLELHQEIRFPHSLGLLYSAFTYYTGFRVNSGEYKLMGLAPYGEPVFVDLIKQHLVDIKDDGSFRLDQKYFNYCSGLTMTSGRFHRLFGHAPRKPEEPIEQFHMDVARSIQVVTEEIILKIARHLKQYTREENLCLAGGVALNCVANGKIIQGGLFKRVWIQPAASDAGGALGAALAVWYNHLGKPRAASGKGDAQKCSLLGPEFSDAQIEAFLKERDVVYTKLTDDELFEKAAEILASEKVLGWFQGRMEFGPRALGNRSILGDPRSEEMQTTMNLKIKFRESFRPFAPSVMLEHAGDYFEYGGESPYMLVVSDLRWEKRFAVPEEQKSLIGLQKLKIKRSELPAITHVDYSARTQTVSKEEHPTYYKLLNAFYKKTGC